MDTSNESFNLLHLIVARRVALDGSKVCALWFQVYYRGLSIYCDTILGAPYYWYSLLYPQNPILIAKAPALRLCRVLGARVKVPECLDRLGAQSSSCGLI